VFGVPVSLGNWVVLCLHLAMVVSGICLIFTNKPGDSLYDEYREDGFNSSLGSNRSRASGLFIVAIGLYFLFRDFF
jgi:hypothetical protein